METAQHPTSALRWSAHLQQIAEETRQFWSRRRVRLALMIVCAVLLLEWGVSATFHIGSTEKWGRGPEVYHQISLFFGMRPQWARAMLVTKEMPDPGGPLGGFLFRRDPITLICSLLGDLRGIALTLLIPIFAALAFAPNEMKERSSKAPLRRLVRRAMATVGPLGAAAVALTVIGEVVQNAIPTWAILTANDGLYLSERFARLEWGLQGMVLLCSLIWILVSMALYSTLAAALRDPARSFPTCIGMSLFGLPLLTFGVVMGYPGGLQAIPFLLNLCLTPLLSLAVIAFALPFALRSLRSDRSGDLGAWAD